MFSVNGQRPSGSTSKQMETLDQRLQRAIASQQYADALVVRLKRELGEIQLAWNGVQDAQRDAGEAWKAYQTALTASRRLSQLYARLALAWIILVGSLVLTAIQVNVGSKIAVLLVTTFAVLYILTRSTEWLRLRKQPRDLKSLEQDFQRLRERAQRAQAQYQFTLVGNASVRDQLRKAQVQCESWQREVLTLQRQMVALHPSAGLPDATFTLTGDLDC